MAGERVFRNVERFPEVRTFRGTLILRVDASLYFANTSFLENRLRNAVVEHPDYRNIILDFSGVNDMDAVAVETLERLIDELESQGVTVRIAAMKGPVRDITARAGWPRKFGAPVAHFSLESALRAAGEWQREGHLEERRSRRPKFP